MCSCGCNNCDIISPLLNENKISREILSEGLLYHINNNKPLTEHVYRAGSEAYFNLWAEARSLYSRDLLEMVGEDLQVIIETDLGHFGMFEGKKVPLDFPMVSEAEYKGREVELNKPKRGGPKKFFVYVRDPKTKKIKKITFGDTTGLKAKINNPVARKAFAKRHRCGTGEPKTSARYWSCRLPRYAKLLGLKNNFSGFW